MNFLQNAAKTVKKWPYLLIALTWINYFYFFRCSPATLLYCRYDLYFLSPKLEGQNARLNGKILEQAKGTLYLGSIFSRDARYETDAARRVAAGNRVNGAAFSCIRCIA